MPISDGARKFFQKYFKGREVYIGLDTAVTLWPPNQTIAVGLLLIPIMLILASILPGNSITFADLPVAPFFICMATVIHRGDLIRTLISLGRPDDYRPADRHQFAPYFSEMAL